MFIHENDFLFKVMGKTLKPKKVFKVKHVEGFRFYFNSTMIGNLQVKVYIKVLTFRFGWVKLLIPRSRNVSFNIWIWLFAQH